MFLEDTTMNRFDKVGPEMTGVELVDSSLARNPCPDSTEVYFTYPYDSHMFVMCVGNMPFILACPDNLQWNSDINACDWPDLGPPEEDYDYDQSYTENGEDTGVGTGVGMGEDTGEDTGETGDMNGDGEFPDNGDDDSVM